MQACQAAQAALDFAIAYPAVADDWHTASSALVVSLQPRVADMAVCEQWLDRFSQWPQP
jgi:hypothetical protein